MVILHRTLDWNTGLEDWTGILVVIVGCCSLLIRAQKRLIILQHCSHDLFLFKWGKDLQARCCCCKYVEVYLQSLVTTNVFLGLQTFHLEHPENRQRQPAMLTVRHRYMCIITEAL